MPKPNLIFVLRRAAATTATPVLVVSVSMMLALGCGRLPNPEEAPVPTVVATEPDGETVPLTGPEPLVVEALPIPFNSEDAGITTVGGARFLTAFELRSSAVRFGGFSGLKIEGDRILAISDRGHWWTSPLLSSEEGHIEGFGPGLMGPILHTDGKPVEGREEHDAEDLIVWQDGYLVSYEVDHRIHYHRRTEPGAGISGSGISGAGASGAGISGAGPMGLPTKVERLSAPEALAEVDENEGLEAMVELDDGRLLVFVEKDEGEGEHRAFVGRPDEGTWESLSMHLPEGLHPTAAAKLPSGRILLLERGWNPVEGVKIRLSTIRSEFRGGERLQPEELALLRPPLAVDNMEAMDVGVGPGGQVWIYLLSDDNYSDEQRTLLLQLELIDGEDP